MESNNVVSLPSSSRILLAGIVGGIVLNLIDTPWSVIVMVPKMTQFLDAHGLSTNVLTGPWLLSMHIVFTVAIAYLYALMRTVYGAGIRTALSAGAVFLLLNRGFGFGNVLMGTFTAELFFGFSIGMVLGTVVASLVIGWMIDRSRST